MSLQPQPVEYSWLHTMRKGFTFSQAIFVISLIAILAAVTTPGYLRFQSSQRLYSTSDTLLFDMRFAQAKAMERTKDDQWGIHIDDTAKAYVLYYGATYSAVEPNNIVVDYPSTVALSPNGDILFAAITGVPGASATITVSSTTTTLSESISINNEGNIERN